MREEGDQKLEWRLNDNDRQQMLMEKKKKNWDERRTRKAHLKRNMYFFICL